LNFLNKNQLKFYTKKFYNLINNLNEDKSINQISSTKQLISTYNDICISKIKILKVGSSLYTDEMKKINVKLLHSILKGKIIFSREDKICETESINYGNLENLGIIFLNPIYANNSSNVEKFTVLSPFINLLQISKTLDFINREPVLQLTESFTPDKNEIQDIFSIYNNLSLFEKDGEVDLNVIFLNFF